MHHWYCGSEISCNARPDSIHHSSRFAASSLQQLVFPHSSCSAVCVQVTQWEERGSACPGQARLRGQGTAGQEGGCCRCSPPTLTHCYQKLIRTRGMRWKKSHPRNIRSFSWLWFVGVWLVWGAYFVVWFGFVFFFKLWTFLFGKLKLVLNSLSHWV